MNSDARGDRQPGTRRRRSDGEQSRTAILDAAARLATIEGIEGLSIARLAKEVGISKSGLFAHFGSKEDLQLATVEKAEALFAAQVVDPAKNCPAALDRLRMLVESYLRYVAVETFPGGCFFASVLAEVDMRPGPVRARLVRFLADWLSLLESTVRDAQAEGAIPADEDVAQLVFEIEAALFLANAEYVVMRTAEPMDRARRAIDRRLVAASPAPPARRGSQRRSRNLSVSPSATGTAG